MKKVYIVLVNWNRYAETARCIESLKKAEYAAYRIVVVDNASTDGSAGKLEKNFPDCAVIRNASNAGFAGGVNAGIRRALEEKAEYILIINNDTEVRKDFLSALVGTAESDARIGIVTGKIYYMEDKQKIWSYGGVFDVNTGMARHCKHEDESRKQYKHPVYFYAQGCLLLIKAGCINDVGLLSELFFHLGEDVEYCVRAQRRGWKIALSPGSVIYHDASSSMRFFSPLYNYYEQRNRLYIIKEYHTYNHAIDAIGASVIIAARIFAAVFLNTDSRHFFANVKYISSGIRDFIIGRSGKRF